MEHTDTETLFIVYLKFKYNSILFLFAKFSAIPLPQNTCPNSENSSVVSDSLQPHGL